MHTAYAETNVQILGPLKTVTPPSGMVITRKELKDHARIIGNDDDAKADFCIRVATNACEKRISGFRQFLTAQYSVPVAGWWCGDLKLPRPPLQSVDGVFYSDGDSVQQTLVVDQYVIYTPWGQPGTIYAAQDVTWPTLGDARYPIEIRFTCGYGAAADVPDEIKYAILTLATNAYCNRCQIDPDVLGGIGQFLENSFGYGSYS